MIYGNVELYNVAELLTMGDELGKILSRIPNNLRLALNPNAKMRALSGAGCEIRFNLRSSPCKVTLLSEALGIAEVFQGSFRVSWHVVGTEPTEIPIDLPQNIDLLDKVAKNKGLPFDTYLTRVILPYRPFLRLVDVQGMTSPPRQEQTPERKYLAYGSSITQGTSAIRPTGSYAMKTSQTLGVDLINLGFGGGAHCEGEMADYIAQRDDWDFATLEMGVNMVGSFETEEFKDRAEYFIETAAKSHPDKWIFCIDMFTCRHDFMQTSRKQDEFREIVRNTVGKIGMPRVVHVDGRTILKGISGLTSDLTHPASAGMEEMAMNLSRLIKGEMETR